jgi:cell shape-determining protein MreC
LARLLAATRTQGPVKGTGEPLLEMEYVSSDEKIAVGEAVLTSGQDHIFPKDLPVGNVVEAQPDPHSPFMSIRVRPGAQLDQLEEVLILLTRQDFNLSQGGDASATDAPSAEQPQQLRHGRHGRCARGYNTSITRRSSWEWKTSKFT